MYGGCKALHQQMAYPYYWWSQSITFMLPTHIKILFKKAMPLTEYNKREISKYYDYFESTGHDIVDYNQLNDETETLISRAS